jgi:hypothetical protein
LGVENKDRLVRYWLGDLPEAEKLRLEKECLADDQLSETLKEVENDLLDSYVCEELSEKQRAQFEQNYLDSSEKHEQVELARLLMNPGVRQSIAATAIPVREEAQPWWRASFFQMGNPAVRLATIAVGMAVTVAVVLLMIQNHRLRMEVSRLEAEQTKLHEQIAELQRNANAPNTAGTPTGDGSGGQKVTVSALLKPGLAREGGGANGNSPLIIPASASSVVLLLDLPSDRYPLYNTAVETVEGRIIYRVEGLSRKSARGGRVIEVPLPAQVLPRGDYIVRLFGVKSNRQSQAVDSYTVSVSR